MVLYLGAWYVLEILWDLFKCTKTSSIVLLV